MDNEELKKGSVVFLKASSGLCGYGNAQCVREVHCEQLGTFSLYGHNQHYKTYDIDRIIEPPSPWTLIVKDRPETLPEWKFGEQVLVVVKESGNLLMFRFAVLSDEWQDFFIGRYSHWQKVKMPIPTLTPKQTLCQIHGWEEPCGELCGEMCVNHNTDDCKNAKEKV